jgi:hypothetical protein
MADLFTPYTIINSMMAVVSEDSEGWKQLGMLKKDLSYCAPERIDARFWGKTRCKNIVEICMKYFNENDKIHDIYVESVKRYNASGFMWSL